MLDQILPFLTSLVRVMDNIGQALGYRDGYGKFPSWKETLIQENVRVNVNDNIPVHSNRKRITMYIDASG